MFVTANSREENSLTTEKKHFMNEIFPCLKLSAASLLQLFRSCSCFARAAASLVQLLRSCSCFCSEKLSIVLPVLGMTEENGFIKVPQSFES